MTNEERYNTYIREHCSRCKNKATDKCEIRIFALDKTVYTKCINYERDEEDTLGE